MDVRNKSVYRINYVACTYVYIVLLYLEVEWVMPLSLNEAWSRLIETNYETYTCYRSRLVYLVLLS